MTPNIKINHKIILLSCLLFNLDTVSAGFIANTAVRVPRLGKIGSTLTPIKNIKPSSYIINLAQDKSLSTEHSRKYGCSRFMPDDISILVPTFINTLHDMASQLEFISPLPSIIVYCIGNVVSAIVDFNIYLMTCAIVSQNLLLQEYGLTPNEQFYHLRINKEEFYASEDQEFFSVDKGCWMQINELVEGETLLLMDAISINLYTAKCEFIRANDSIESNYNIYSKDKLAFLVGKSGLIAKSTYPKGN